MAYQGLAAQLNIANSPVVYQVTDTQLSQLGAALDTSAATGGAGISPTAFNGRGNDAIVLNAWGGLYTFSEVGLHRYDPGTANNWPVIYDALTGFGQPRFDVPVGPYYFVEDNVPYVGGVLMLGGNMWTVKWNLLTDSIAAATSHGITNSQAVYGNVVFWRGKIYWPLSGGFLQAVNITGAGSYAQIPILPASNPAQYGSSLCVFNDSLYGLSKNGSGNTEYHLYQLTQGKFLSVLNVFTAPAVPTGTTPVLFTDGSAMYAIMTTTTGGSGWVCYQLDLVGGNIVLGSNLTSTVIPPTLQPGGVGASNNDQWRINITNNTDGTREIHLWFVSGITGSDLYTIYRWVDNNTVMTQLDTANGLAGNQILAANSNGGGERQYIPDAPEITIYSKEPAAGGEKLTFRCFGGQTGQIVRFYIGSGGDAPETQVNLIGDATGGTAFRNGNQIESVDCDGTTDYTITIQALGFSPLDYIETIARVSAI
jgi:hypothetical protein